MESLFWGIGLASLFISSFLIVKWIRRNPINSNKNAHLSRQNQEPEVQAEVVTDVKNKFEFICPKSWEELSTTNDEKVRFCSRCDQNIYKANTIEELDDLAKEKKCSYFKSDKVEYLDPPAFIGVLASPDKSD